MTPFSLHHQRPAPMRLTRGTDGVAHPAPRRTRVEIHYVPLWPVVKLALVGSTAVVAALAGAIALLWSLAESAGLVREVEEFVASMIGADEFVIASGPLLTGLVLVSLVVVALVTLGAVVVTIGYNLLAALGGGLEVDLRPGELEHETYELLPVATGRNGGAHGNGSARANGHGNANGGRVSGDGASTGDHESPANGQRVSA